MAIELHFCKSDNTPWGFRLTGGADCDIPLTVIKVAEDSIAENAGLQVDDVIVRINDDSTAGLTHAEAHDVFLAAGSDFHIAVRRGDAIDIRDDEQNNEEVSNILESSFHELSVDLESQQTNIHSEKGLLQNNSKLHVTDEQIAEAISGETELLPDQNVLGVNFNKVDLTESTVLKVINEQTTETKVDNKKWSTFLQKPKTPKIIPKKKEPEGPTAPPYRVIIKKQQKKTSETINKDVEVSSKAESEKENEIDNPEPEELREECEEIVDEREEAESEPELPEETLNEQAVADEDVSDYAEEEICDGISAEEKNSETVTTESTVTLEEQLAQVQQQLQALAQLPSAIQVSLDAVTQQLAKIVKSTHKDEQEMAAEQSIISENEKDNQIAEGETAESSTTSDIENYINIVDDNYSNTSENDTLDNDEIDNQIQIDLEIPEMTTEEVHEEWTAEEEQEKDRIEKERASQQERKLTQLQESHQRRLEQRPTHPLTPLQRPIILPGGRRWSQPNDALPTPRKPKMTDEKICSTIENYSEVITGRVKGLTSGILFGHGPIQQNLYTGICNLHLM